MKIRLSDYVAQRFNEIGIKHIFLVTGGGAMHLNDAFSRNKNLSVICYHHEQSAAIAAESYSRSSGKPAVLNVTSGPGAINALNGVYGAYVDSISMIVISGQVKRETLSSNCHQPIRQLGDQEVDIVSITKPIVKYSATIDNPEDIFNILEKAIYVSKSGRPGPVWIDIPIDVQSAIIETDGRQVWSPNIKDLADDKNISKNTHMEFNLDSKEKVNQKISTIIERLSSSKRPVIFAGTGVRLSNTNKLFIDLIEKLQIPVVTGWNAHDLLSYRNNYYAGKPGTVGDRAGNFTVQNSDFILVLGCRLNIRQISYNWNSFASNAWKCIVDIDLAELSKPTLSADLSVHTDLRTFIPELINQLSDYIPQVSHQSYLKWCKERVLKYDPLNDINASSSLINPYSFLDKFFHFLPSKSIVVCGNGSACVMGFQSMKNKESQQIFSNSGCASMGYDLPAAIGAYYANPYKNIICLTGDGSVMMNIQELATIAGNNLPIKIFILNNDGYSSIQQSQKAYFPDNIFGTSSENGLYLPDFTHIASAFGIKSYKISESIELTNEFFFTIFESNQPILIDIKVDPNQPFMPKLASRKLDDGTMLSPRLENMWPFLTDEEFQSNLLIE